jgi:phospho-N-acetylmuramoyl-pentapeptide-transferase
MLYHLLYALHERSIVFNVFRYITFRVGLATVTAFVLSLAAGPWMIEKLKAGRVGQVIRSDGPETHFVKAGTPTMGGLLIVAAVAIATLLWSDLRNIFIWTVLIITLGFALIGFWDDYKKIVRQNSQGLSAREKLLYQAVVTATGLVFMVVLDGCDYRLSVPFFKMLNPSLGPFYVLFALLVIVGSSNAVNLTDGLDGLAIGPVAIVAATYALFAYIVGRADYTAYLNLPHVTGAGELAIFCGALFGAALGFLWFNTYPAQVIMGDVGALALGGAIGAVAVVTKHELVLALVGGLFVAEALSVIIQVSWYKRTRRRVFLMAPLHHHFEKKGWAEPKIIVRFWIVQIILALMAISTLKLR